MGLESRVGLGTSQGLKRLFSSLMHESRAFGMSCSFGMDWFEISSRGSLRPVKGTGESCKRVYRLRAAGNAD